MPARVAVARASSRRPSLASQTGVSGRKYMPMASTAPGIAAIASIASQEPVPASTELTR